jgi:glycosyltransferase involved in cell wall biosynthesis
VVIPNGVAAEEFDAPPALDFRRAHGITTPHLAICVANFYPDKGHRDLIASLRRLARPDLTTVLIGRPGPGPALAEAQAACRDLPGLRVLTAASRQETLAAYHAADLFLFASQLECFPLVILEAMASRTAFVSTDCGNVRQLPGGVVCGIEALHLEVGRLLDDPARRRALAEAGHAAWRRHFTWEGVVDQYEALYRALLRGERPASAI